MDGWFQQYINQLKELWSNLNRRAKIIIGIGALGVLVVLVFLLIWSGGNTDYQPLFSQLSSRDASAIVNKLEEKGVPYTLENNGSTIKVPEQNLYKTRLEIAGEGLPTQGVVGFEIFNKSQFGTTDFERRVNFYRALGGELSRSIQVMNGVDFAKVQISASEDSLFAEEEKPAEASVLLKLHPGYRLSDSQVKAISNLVASSVQGLSTDKVTVVDTAGNLLAINNAQNNTTYNNQLTMNQFEIQQEFAEGLKADLEAMLTKVLGPDNFTVQVHARLNFDQREVESKTYSPVVGEEGIVRSQQEQLENYEGKEVTTGGTPGTTSNIPQYQAEDGNDNSAGNYEKSDVITNYEINERIERQVYSPGEIEKLSVAVIINDNMEDDLLEKIKNSVQAAIGYTPERGDLVTVTDMVFDNSLEKEVAKARAVAKTARMKKTYIYAGLIVLILIFILTGFIILRRGAKPQEYVGGQHVDLTVGEELEKAKKQAATTELSEEEEERMQMKEELQDLVADQPEEVAQLLKSWLMEE